MYLRACVRSRFGREPGRRLLVPSLLITLLLCALSLLVAGCGGSATAAREGTTAANAANQSAAQAPATQSSTSASGGATAATAAGSDLFDASLVHDITVSFSQEDYDAMINEYSSSGDKQWIKATVTIDGKTFKDVGMRLKGNSSLMSLRRGGAAMPGAAGGNNGGNSKSGTSTTLWGITTTTTNQAGGAAPSGAGTGGTTPSAAGAGAINSTGTNSAKTIADQSTTSTTALAAAGGGQNLPVGPGGNVSADSPQGLPWLIKLDKYVDGQNYQGVTELAVRSNNSKTSLNEALSLELLKQAGLATEKAIAVRFTVNGSDAALKLVIENPDDLWMAENFSATGALYKAEASGNYNYRGTDPDLYDDVFDQEAGKTNTDLTPLIDFLDFVNNSDDATFNAELPNRLDIDSFATYLAFEDLVSNFDDMDGPGNNSYLYYDTKTQKFTVVAWDHNLAFGITNKGRVDGNAGANAGGNNAGGNAGGGWPGGAGGWPGDGGQAPQGAPAQGMRQISSTSADQSLTQLAAPGGAQGAQGNGQGNARGQLRGNQGGVNMRGNNILVKRFKANAEWNQLYLNKLAELRTKLYESGTATNLLSTWTSVLKAQAPDLVDSATVDQEAANISSYFTSN
jgi:spore coat protein CotH